MFSKIIEALKEPMLIILAFGLIITLGSCIGELFKTGHADFTECLGIFIAILLSVSITLFMEGSSEKAFKTLNSFYGDLSVKVIREGRVILVSQKNLVVGDIVQHAGICTAGNDGQEVQGAVEAYKAQTYIQKQENDVFCGGDGSSLSYMIVGDQHLHQRDHVDDHSGGIGEDVAGFVITKKQQVQNKEKVAGYINEQHLPLALEQGHSKAAECGKNTKCLGDEINRIHNDSSGL